MSGLTPADVDLAFLSSSPAFGAIGEQDLVDLLPHLSRRAVAAGEVVVSQGDAAREMYVVESGELEVVVERDGGGSPVDPPLLLSTMRRGDEFGEMSLLDVQSRSATVRALSESSLLVLRYRELLAFQKDHPRGFLLLYMNVAREVSRRLRAAERHLIEETLRRGTPTGVRAQG